MSASIQSFFSTITRKEYETVQEKEAQEPGTPQENLSIKEDIKLAKQRNTLEQVCNHQRLKKEKEVKKGLRHPVTLRWIKKLLFKHLKKEPNPLDLKDLT